MAQYIDKAALVAEIDRLSVYLDCFLEKRIIEKILSFIDTLEVKEIDLEKEIELVKGDYEQVDVASNIFPELKESEDERMLRALREGFNILDKDDEWYSGRTNEQILAWLEKQGQTFTKKDVDDAYLKGICVAKHELEKQGEQKPVDKVSPKFHEGEWVAISTTKGDRVAQIVSVEYFQDGNPYYITTDGRWFGNGTKARLLTDKDAETTIIPENKAIALRPQNRWESSEEQKDYTSKVETKFKDGDWIVHHGTGNIYQVVAVIDNQYQLKYGDTYTVQKCTDVDRCVRLWDITKDAKDGDVLCYKDEISLYKHDIKNCTKQKTIFGGFVYHCCYDGKRFITDSFYSLTEQDKMDIHPATKEQRDLLFQKMREAGYVWNGKKKAFQVVGL